ncbi:MAG: SDR family oxidoreductase [Gammaproteobacteria bacterium]|nr:MAG: SDR family oxidoreductase [Gammaproteobacteria bacterium]
MKDFNGRLAVITGGGAGMGREIAIQLARQGCHIAMCDLDEANMVESRELALADAAGGTRVSTHRCDVSDPEQVHAFRDAVLAEHDTDQINLLFNNAGIGGGGSFVNDPEDNWQKTFDICWGGVYHCSRAFLPALMAADAGHIVNTSSINGFWASIGPQTPHTAYSAAKFAVKGFSEALITDLRLNAPHVNVSVVMPGHIGTSIVENSGKVLGRSPDSMSSEEISDLRDQLASSGLPVGNLPDDSIRDLIRQRARDFRDNAPTTAAEAANVIIEGVRAGRWRILIGDDAHIIDQLVRDDPEAAYEPNFVARIAEHGHLQQLIAATEPQAG